MKELELGGLRVLLAGGTDREGGGEGPLVVLLHGFGAPGDDLASLWRVIDAPAGTRWAFPAAPLALDATGYAGARAWWMIDIERHLTAMERGETDAPRETPPGMDEARAKVVAMLDALEAAVRPSKTVLGGFSQGAMVSCDVALRTERPLAGIALLSGTLAARDAWEPRVATRKGLRVFQSHGQSDAMLPYARAETLRDMLREGGLDVTWVPFRGGHEIPQSVVSGLGTWLRAALA
ncbi:MAG TPA: alpha/beta fold hydrolase [Polyangiaceae bacterium]|jgi:phospholipase/carboxylesterase